MIYQKCKKIVAFTACLIAPTLTASAHAAKLSDVFNSEMLGVTQRYFESIAGIPRESFMDTHSFKIEGCEVQATIRGGNITALRLELGPKCSADVSSFLHYDTPKSRRFPFGLFSKAMTVGDFTESVGPMRYYADCLSNCGNSHDPSVYASWSGPRAIQFLDALIEVQLVDDAAIKASRSWREHMVRTMGEDYVMETRFNCDNQFSAEAANAFKDVAVTAITFGRDLKVPECPAPSIQVQAPQKCAYTLEPDEADTLWHEMRSNPQAYFDQCSEALTQMAIEYGGDTPQDARKHAEQTCLTEIQSTHACMATPGTQANECICGMDP